MFFSLLKLLPERVQVLALKRPLQQLGQHLRIAGKAGNPQRRHLPRHLCVIVGLAPVGNGQQADNCHPGFLQLSQPPEQGGGTAIGQLGVFSFEDNLALERNDRGLFTGEGARQSEDFEIWNKYLERSNTDMVKQMTEMITYQRALQSAAQVTKMYDQLMTKATGEVGRFA